MCAKELSTPKLQKLGDDYLFTWTLEQLEARVSFLHQHNSDITGQLSLRYTNTETNGHLHEANFNFTGFETRKRLAELLTKKSSEYNWLNCLELICYNTVQEWRRPAPVQDPRNATPVETKYLVQGIIIKDGNTTLYADGGTGKSTLALGIGICVAAGINFCGAITQQTKVLYLDFERTFPVFVRRYHSICNGLKLNEKPELQYLKCDKPLFELAPELRKTIDSGNYGLIIIDSAGFASGEDPESANTALRLFRGIRSFNRTAIIIDHISKGEGAKGPFGSAYKRNSTDLQWRINSTTEYGGSTLHISLKPEKANDIGNLTEIGYQIKFEPNGTVITKEDPRTIPELAENMKTPDRIIGYLEGGPATEKAIAEELSIKGNTVHGTLYRLKGKGLVLKDIHSDDWSLNYEKR